jgi:hypothetical protein
MADVELNSISNGNGTNYLVRDNTKIPLSGSNQISGSLIPATDNSVNLGDSTYGFASFYVNKIYLKGSTIFNLVDDNYICIGGSTAQANGANLVLNGKNRSTSTGEFKLEARDGTNVKQLIGKPDGTLSWNGDIISNGNGAYDLGSTNNGFKNIYFNNEHSKVYYGGTTLSLRSIGNGAGCGLGYGAFYPSKDNAWSLGSSSVRWTQLYASSSTISTSDERQKDNIKQIDDKLLQAWENVNIVQFNFKDALEKKGENARLHTGYIAQNIQQACEERGVNPNDYGLFCFDSWEEQEEKKDENGQVIESYRAKGDLYSLRYEEALVVECAYLRKKNKDLQEQLNALSERLEKLENR